MPQQVPPQGDRWREALCYTFNLMAFGLIFVWLFLRFIYHLYLFNLIIIIFIFCF